MNLVDVVNPARADGDPANHLERESAHADNIHTFRLDGTVDVVGGGTERTLGTIPTCSGNSLPDFADLVIVVGNHPTVSGEFEVTVVGACALDVTWAHSDVVQRVECLPK